MTSKSRFAVLSASRVYNLNCLSPESTLVLRLGTAPSIVVRTIYEDDEVARNSFWVSRRSFQIAGVEANTQVQDNGPHELRDSHSSRCNENSCLNDRLRWNSQVSRSRFNSLVEGATSIQTRELDSLEYISNSR